MAEQSSFGSMSRTVLDRIFRRKKPRGPPVIKHLGAAQSTPVLNIDQAFNPASVVPGGTALPRLDLIWHGPKFNEVVDSVATAVEEEMGRAQSRGFAAFAKGMARITELCSCLAKWRILCGPSLVEETTAILAAEGCRVAMHRAPTLDDLTILVHEASGYDPLGAPAPDQARLFAWYRLLQHLTQQWEIFIRKDPCKQAAYWQALTRNYRGGPKLRNDRVEVLLEYGRALNGITGAFQGSIGILMLLPQTFAVCVQSYGSLALISFFTRLATRVPALVSFCAGLEEKVLCSINSGEPLNDTIVLFEDLNSGIRPRVIPIADMSRTLLPARRQRAVNTSQTYNHGVCGLGTHGGYRPVNDI